MGHAHIYQGPRLVHVHAVAPGYHAIAPHFNTRKETSTSRDASPNLTRRQNHTVCTHVGLIDHTVHQTISTRDGGGTGWMGWGGLWHEKAPRAAGTGHTRAHDM